MELEKLSKNFDSLVAAIKENQWNIYGVEVYLDGEIVHSFGDISTRYPIYSGTKTILSMAVGIAVSEGKLSLDDSILRWIPEQFLEQVSQEQKNLFETISIRRLLTMSVEEFPFRASGDNWTVFALNCKINPEKKGFNYSNICAHLVSVALSVAVGMNSYDYICQKIFAPMGIYDVPYENSPEGYFNGGSTLQLTVSEFTKIGELILKDGFYDGKQIVPSDYVKAAKAVQIMCKEGGYGYFIWKIPNGVSINGKWGQKVYIFQEENLMVSFLSNLQSRSSAVLLEILKWFE